MNGYTVAAIVSAFVPAVVFICASIRMALDDRDRISAAAGFGWAGFFLGVGGLALASQIVAKVLL